VEAGGFSLAETELVIECWDYDALSQDDLIGKAIVAIKDLVAGREIQLENSRYDSSNNEKGTNILHVRRVAKIGFQMESFGKSAEAVMEELERELSLTLDKLMEEKECRADLEERIKRLMRMQAAVPEQTVENQHELVQQHQQKLQLPSFHLFEQHSLKTEAAPNGFAKAKLMQPVQITTFMQTLLPSTASSEKVHSCNTHVTHTHTHTHTLIILTITRASSLSVNLFRARARAHTHTDRLYKSAS
jgi:hypothetical protein